MEETELKKELTVKEHMTAISPLGNEVMKKKGSAYFAKISKIGWAKRKKKK